MGKLGTGWETGGIKNGSLSDADWNFVAESFGDTSGVSVSDDGSSFGKLGTGRETGGIQDGSLSDADCNSVAESFGDSDGDSSGISVLLVHYNSFGCPGHK
jgi:hypothetical protein